MGNHNRKTKKFRWWKIPAVLLLLILMVVCGYFAYIFLTYDRIPDNQEISPEGDAAEMVQAGEEYTAVSYNIGFGAYTADFTFFMDGGKESRARSKESVETCVSETTNTALSFDPDFVMFQEVDIDSTRSWHVDESEIIKRLFAEKGVWDSAFASNYHSAYLMYPLTSPHGASNSGLLTVSRADITSVLRRSLPISTGFKKLLDLDRCYSISRIPVDNDRELILINAHLSAYGTDAAQGNAQLEMLFGDMEREYEKGSYVICCGDFNHDFTTDSVAYFNNGSTADYSWCQPFPDDVIPEGFSKCTDYSEGMCSTSRCADMPYSPDNFTVILDGFIVSDNVRCTYIQNIDTGYQYSDHNPVVMKFICYG